jgi:hypothetical protein
MNEHVPPEHVLDAVIESKKSHIDEIAAPRIENLSARQEAYQRIVNATKRGMAEYYNQFPSRAIDERSLDAEKWSLNGLRAIFGILDDYTIYHRREMHMSTGQTPQNPQPPQHQSTFAAIMGDVYKYTGLAATAVLQAQAEGVGQDGETKQQMALSIVHAGLKGAGLFVPGVAPAAVAEQQLEPIFIPLFTSLVNMFRAHGHPAFTNPAPSPASPAPASGQ